MSLLVVALLAAAGPRFIPVEDHGIWWLRGPNGQQVFSRGVCVVDPGVKWEEYDPANPSYAGFHFYPDRPAWAADACRTLESGGFNTIGAWSDYDALLAVPHSNLYMTPIIHMGSSAGFPWLDMWDPANVKICDDVARGLITKLKSDKRIIGYFSDNELGWWKGGVFDWLWKNKTTYERAQVARYLERYYKGSWARFLRDFRVIGASSFAGLSKTGKVVVRTPGSLDAGNGGVRAVSGILGFLADRYYSLCRSIIKKYDPAALFLGDRYISNYYPEVAQAAGRYCDVVSTNLNPAWPDGGYPRFYLSSLEELTHRPLMITEYYMCARQGRSGNSNAGSGFPVVDTLQERTEGFRRTTLDLMHDPYVMGAHWFQYYDEPAHGRGDGENYNFGLVDIFNKPYAELLDTSRRIDEAKEHGRAAGEQAVSVGPIPQAPADVNDMTKWDRQAAFVQPAGPVARGDLYVGRTAKGLCLSLIWHEDRFAEGLFGTKTAPREAWPRLEVWAKGREWTFTLEPNGGVTMRGRPEPPSGFPRETLHYSPGVVSRATIEFLSSEALVSGHATLEVVLTSESGAYTTRWHVDRPVR